MTGLGPLPTAPPEVTDSALAPPGSNSPGFGSPPPASPEAASRVAAAFATGDVPQTKDAGPMHVTVRFVLELAMTTLTHVGTEPSGLVVAIGVLTAGTDCPKAKDANSSAGINFISSPHQHCR